MIYLGNVQASAASPSPPHIASPVAHKTSHKNLVGFRHVGHDRYEGLVASQSLSCASGLVQVNLHQSPASLIQYIPNKL